MSIGVTEANLAKFLAGYRPAPQKVSAVLAGGVENPIKLRVGAHRWKYAAKLLIEMHAEGVRLFDGDGAIMGSMDLCEAPSDATAESTDTALPASSSTLMASKSTEIAIIVNATADAVVRGISAAMKSQSESNRVAFEQLAKVAELATDRVGSLEGLVQSLIDARAKDLEAREQAANEEHESDGADAVMKPLLQGAGAELVNKLPQLLQMANQAGLIGTPPTAPAVTAPTNGASHGAGK